MSIYLISHFHTLQKKESQYQKFLGERIKLIHAHGGEILSIFQPANHHQEDSPDEIHIIRFISSNTFNAYQDDLAHIDLTILQRESVEKCVEYHSETTIPTESKFETIISSRPPASDPEPMEADEMVEHLTQLIERPDIDNPHPSQRQTELDTQLYTPQNNTQRKLSKLVPIWQKNNDRRVVFAHTYFLMTNNMLEALNSGMFHDNKWVQALLDRFAEFYFDALENYETARTKTPPIWNVAFQVSENPNSFTAQHLLLGVNAHINYDLTKTLIELLKDEWIDLDLDQKQERYEDHTRVNQIIKTTFDETQNLIIARYSPTLDMLNQFAFNLDDLLISKMIDSWREQAWQHAIEYLEAPTNDQKLRVIQETEYIALRRADMIMLKRGPFRMQTLF